MKNSLIIGGVLAGAVAAALLAWATFGGGGASRHAVLQEPTGGGFIGRMSMSAVQGAETLRIQSFNWHQACDINGCSTEFEVLRDLDPLTPLFFQVGLVRPNSATVSLDVFDPVTETTYQSWSLTNAKLVEFRVGKREKLAFSYSGQSVTATRGSPEVDRAQVIGHVTFPDERAVPIYGFDAGDRWPASHVVFDRAVIKRPPDRQTPTLVNNLTHLTLLGTVVVELQNTDEETPHATVTFGDAKVTEMTESAAAGISPTEELKLSFRRITVAAGENTSCWDLSSGAAC